MPCHTNCSYRSLHPHIWLISEVSPCVSCVSTLPLRWATIIIYSSSLSFTQRRRCPTCDATFTSACGLLNHTRFRHRQTGQLSTANQRGPDGSTPTSSNSSSSLSSPPASRAVRRRRTHRATSSSHSDTGTLHRSTPSVVSDSTSPSQSSSGSPSLRDSVSVSGSLTTSLCNSPVPPARGSRAASTVRRSSRPSRYITSSGHSTDVPDKASARILVPAELSRPRSPSGHDPELLDQGPVSPTHRAVISTRGSLSSSMAALASSGTLLRPRYSSSLSSGATSHAPDLSEDPGGDDIDDDTAIPTVDDPVMELPPDHTTLLGELMELLCGLVRETRSNASWTQCERI